MSRLDEGGMKEESNSFDAEADRELREHISIHCDQQLLDLQVILAHLETEKKLAEDTLKKVNDWLDRNRTVPGVPYQSAQKYSGEVEERLKILMESIKSTADAIEEYRKIKERSKAAENNTELLLKNVTQLDDKIVNTFKTKEKNPLNISEKRINLVKEKKLSFFERAKKFKSEAAKFVANHKIKVMIGAVALLSIAAVTGVGIALVPVLLPLAAGAAAGAAKGAVKTIASEKIMAEVATRSLDSVVNEAEDCRRSLRGVQGPASDDRAAVEVEMQPVSVHFTQSKEASERLQSSRFGKSDEEQDEVAEDLQAPRP